MPTSSSLTDRSLVRTSALVDMAAELGRRGVAGAMTRRRTTLIALHCLAAYTRKQFDFTRKAFGARRCLRSRRALPA